MKTAMRNMLRNIFPYKVIEHLRSRVRPVDESIAARVPYLLERRDLAVLFPENRPTAVCLPADEVMRADFMASPVTQLAVLALVCQALRPKRVFEFGTYVGSATRVMALNTDATITTLDLDRETRERLFGGTLQYDSGASFAATDEASRIEQVFGDSRSFDYSLYIGQMDLVFVDANHTYPFVKNDTDWARKLVKSDGVIIWDDYLYTDEHPECCGVAQYLNELRSEFFCCQIQDSRLAIGFPGNRVS